MTSLQLAFVVLVLILANVFSYRYKTHTSTLANVLVIMTLAADLLVVVIGLGRTYSWLGTFSL